MAGTVLFSTLTSKVRLPAPAIIDQLHCSLSHDGHQQVSVH